LDGVLQAIGLPSDEDAGRKLTVLRAIDKLDRLGPDGVRELLGPGRKDESGDFTKGAGLSVEDANAILLLFGASKTAAAIPIATATDAPDVFDFEWISPDEVARLRENHSDHEHVRRVGLENSLALGFIQAFFRQLESDVTYREVSLQGYSELYKMAELIHASGYSDRIRIDPSVVRGLEYYTGPVFEAELTFPVVNDEGQTVRFGSVAGGGRYDGLVGRFRPEPVPATGFSIGVSRLLSALQIVKSPIVAAGEERGPVVVLVMDRDRIADYQRMVAQLREAGIRAELYLGSAGMKAQMKYADRRRAPCVVIQGSQEREQGVVQIKDLVEGSAKARDEAAASNAEYRAARLAQVSVPEADLVAAVRKIFEGHGA
jgi:histidyl-tRNA synthetase